MADGEFRHVPVMKIRDAIIPLIRGQSLHVWSCDERAIRLDREPCLECKGLINVCFVFDRRSTIHEEYGDRLDGPVRPGRWYDKQANKHREVYPATVRYRRIVQPACFAY